MDKRTDKMREDAEQAFRQFHGTTNPAGHLAASVLWLLLERDNLLHQLECVSRREPVVDDSVE